MSWVDTHCHLEYDYSPKTTEDLVNEAKAAGVGTLVTIGTEMKTMDTVISISEKFPNVYHTVGVHPHEAKEMVEGDLERLREYSKHEKCRAIGEIGLDYHYDHSPRDIQVQRLKEQLELAIEVSKPVVIHAREAEDDLSEALTVYAKKTKEAVPGVIHCFTGTERFGKTCLDLGFMISFSGVLTFKKSDDLRECARKFPLDRLCVETDSPYLAPVPFRGKKCEPAMVVKTAQKLAEIKEKPIEEIEEITTLNASRLFGFSLKTKV